ncbi:MAG: flagellar hook-basal body complex protein, partial [Halanaerobiales bacterium]
ITGNYSNGVNQSLGQIAIASFSNPTGLTKQGDTLFAESKNSGIAQVGEAGNGGRGEISGGSLEMSNVDLAEQFTEMITAQRGFQANSKIITTSDQMLQDLVGLKR